MMQVWDYRKYASNKGPNPDVVDSPVVTKVRLKISLENVVKDIPPIRSSWTYGDLMVRHCLWTFLPLS